MCRLSWCETPADIHAEDVSHHTRELGFGMMLTVDLNGKPMTNWMPDWSEWLNDRPEDFVAEYNDVAVMLTSLPEQFKEFRDALLSDPKFAEEVAAAKAKDASERTK
ncbi:hypothetical protein KZC52_07525 [Microbacterium sp. kSW2-24]|uniref:hypothetical protein n=1 Tax=Microbacterium galbinum TaxID=2851646 RepID=UPI001FFDBE57|nr:hypothetical protein [Microbacterium galbinum]MCK2022768.1 hypothetical protein [Microbacterium galbinum]